jgi:hypothetical protein
MAYSFVKASANNQTPDETQLVMVYELGRIFDCLLNRGAEDFKAFKAFAQTETADFISMCRMLCEQKGWDFEVLAYDDTGVEVILPRSEQLARIYVALSKVVRGNFYIKRFGKPRNEDPEASMRVVIHWTKMLCNNMDWDFEEVRAIGESKYEERMRDLRETGLNTQLKPEFRRARARKGVLNEKHS